MRFSASSAPALHKEIASHIETGGRRNVLSHVLVSVHQPFLLRFFVNPDGKSLGAHLIGFLLKEQWCIEDYVQRADAEVPQEYAWEGNATQHKTDTSLNIKNGDTV